MCDFVLVAGLYKDQVEKLSALDRRIIFYSSTRLNWMENSALTGSFFQPGALCPFGEVNKSIICIHGFCLPFISFLLH